jgi:hypothetical protein
MSDPPIQQQRAGDPISGSFAFACHISQLLSWKTLLLVAIASVTNHGCRKLRLNQNQGMST